MFGIMLWGFACTQTNLFIPIPVYMINTSILISDCCILFNEVLNAHNKAATIKSGENETSVA